MNKLNKLKIKPFDFILIGLIAIILALSFWIYRLYHNNDNSALEDVYISKGRIEILERQLQKANIKSDSIAILRKTIKELRNLEPVKRTVIIYKYNEKIKNIDSQSADSTLRSITNRLN